MYFNKLVSFVVLSISLYSFINTREEIFFTRSNRFLSQSVVRMCLSLHDMEQVCSPCVYEEGEGGWKTTSLLPLECLGFSLGFLHVLPHSILKTTLWSRYYPHFTRRRTESSSNLPKVTACKPWNGFFLTLLLCCAKLDCWQLGQSPDSGSLQTGVPGPLPSWTSVPLVQAQFAWTPVLLSRRPSRAEAPYLDLRES